MDADCAGGAVCQGCQCVNPPACTSGIGIDEPVLRLRATPFVLRLKGQAVIPKPWSGVDPLANVVRLVVDATSGPGGLDVVVPGGPPWTRNAAGTRWAYGDPAGAVGGITRIVVQDRSTVQDGLVHWAVRGKGASAVLPPVAAVRTAVVLGTPGECASITWNPPGGPPPRCTGDATRLVCR